MIVGLDLGTTTVSACLYDPEFSEVVQSISLMHDSLVPDLPPGYHEQCPMKIWEVALEAIRQLSELVRQPVQGLALTGQMHGILAVDADLNPVTNLVTWRDRRAVDAPVELQNHDWVSETGCSLHPGYGGLTLFHLVRSGDLPQAAHKVLSIAGFVAARLSGRCAIDETFAASWGIWDLPSHQWHRELLRTLRIPAELLPDYVPACTRMGAIVDTTRFGAEPETFQPEAIVYSPLGDNQAGMTGILDTGPSEAVVNIGTSSQFSVLLEKYAFSPHLETRPFPTGRFIQTYAALCGGWSYSYLAHFFQEVVEQIGGQEINLVDVMSAMDQFCDSADADGLEVDTRFAGERHDPGHSGSVTGIGTANFTPRNLTNGVVHGMVAELVNASKHVDLSAVSGIVAVGNAVRKNPLIRATLEEQFGLPCRLLENSEEAAHGVVKSVIDQGKEILR